MRNVASLIPIFLPNLFDRHPEFGLLQRVGDLILWTPTHPGVFAGRAIEVNGVAVTAANASSGSAARNRFLQSYLNEDEEKYTACWVVRRYIEKGTPPSELGSSSAIVNFVKNAPGAIGYVEEWDVQAGVIVLLR